jgi:hypothetical protein
MFDRTVGIAGLALALLSAAIPHYVPKYPDWAATAGLLAGTFLLGAAATMLCSSRERKAKLSPAKTALLRLHVFADQRMPELLKGQNIFRWYLLRQALVSFSPDRTESHRFPMTTLFITFEPEIEISSLRVRSPDIKLPHHEVKEFNQRYAIVVFGGDLAEGTLEIAVEPAHA